MAAISLFGATGKTGRKVCDRLVSAGHEVHVLVRDPAKLGELADLVQVVQGDVMDAEAVKRTVAGTETVFSLFGHVKGSPDDLQTRGTQNIVDAMQTHGVRRIISLSGGGLRVSEDRPKLPDRLIVGAMKLMAREVLADAEGHLKVLENSGLDWTVVRAPRLNEEPGRGKYRVGWVGVDSSTQISRDDFADFIVTQLEDRRFIGKLPFVSD